MKFSSLLLALTLTLTVPAYAQQPQDGFEALAAAAALVSPQVSTRDAKAPTPEEAAARRQATVERNAPALAQLRLALKLPIVAPIINNYDADQMIRFGKFTDLGYQLRLESEERIAQGNIAGALDSMLTSFDLLAALSHSSTSVNLMTGGSINLFSRRVVAKIIPKADAPMLRNAVERLKAIDARYAPFAEMEELQKVTSIQMVLHLLTDPIDAPKVKTSLATEHGRQEMGWTEAQANEFLSLHLDSIMAQFGEMFDPLIARDRLPFSQARKVIIPPSQGVLRQYRLLGDNDMRDRFTYENNLVEQRLLAGAMELRAIKLESGAYPATFAAPKDPFGDGAPLVYHRDGDGYLLYSVGPDGIDDGGAEIQTLETNRATGAKSVSGRITIDSTGDIAGTIF